MHALFYFFNILLIYIVAVCCTREKREGEDKDVNAKSYIGSEKIAGWQDVGELSGNC